jgi:putative ABC transport system substrate-binding protein
VATAQPTGKTYRIGLLSATAQAPGIAPFREGSLARPGGNVTGTSFPSVEVAGKSLEVLTRAVPRLQRVAVLWNPANPVYQAQMVKETGCSSPIAVGSPIWP